MSTEPLPLLNEIARCPIVAECKAGAAHPCSAVVAVQSSLPLAEHQVPEPWSGHLDRCVVLFLSSNPSISMEEDYPQWGDPLHDSWPYFEDRFEGGPGQIKDGVRSPLSGGGWALKATRFWSSVRARVREPLDDFQPGQDYALTEVVHCKSRDEDGVPEAADYCSARYVPRVLQAAERAAVVVVYGATARRAMERLMDWQLGEDDRYRVEVIGGRLRHVVFLDHPSSYKSVKRLAVALDGHQLEAVRQAAQAAQAERP